MSWTSQERLQRTASARWPPDPQHRVIAPWILASLAFLVLFWQPLSTMVREWFHNADAGHGLLLAPLAVYLAWPAAAAEAAAAATGRVPYADVSARSGAQAIGGAIFEAAVDTTHPLAYGYDERVALFCDNSTFLEPSSQPGTNVALYTDAPLLSGYISDAKLSTLSGSAAVIARGAGSGNVVLMPDNPDFRAFWYGTNGLLLNAVFFGGVF